MQTASEGMAHLSQLKPGVRVIDNLRCRKTILEILSPPQSTQPVFEWSHFLPGSKPVASSWMVQVRDLRSGRVDTIRIDCDEGGLTERFSILADMLPNYGLTGKDNSPAMN